MNNCIIVAFLLAINLAGVIATSMTVPKNNTQGRNSTSHHVANATSAIMLGRCQNRLECYNICQKINDGNATLCAKKRQSCQSTCVRLYPKTPLRIVNSYGQVQLKEIENPKTGTIEIVAEEYASAKCEYDETCDEGCASREAEAEENIDNQPSHKRFYPKLGQNNQIANYGTNQNYENTRDSKPVSYENQKQKNTPTGKLEYSSSEKAEKPETKGQEEQNQEKLEAAKPEYQAKQDYQKSPAEKQSSDKNKSYDSKQKSFDNVQKQNESDQKHSEEQKSNDYKITPAETKNEAADQKNYAPEITNNEEEVKYKQKEEAKTTKEYEKSNNEAKTATTSDNTSTSNDYQTSSTECATCKQNLAESTASQDYIASSSISSNVDYQTASTECTTCKQNHTESTTSQDYTSTTPFVDYQTPCSTCKNNQTESTTAQEYTSTSPVGNQTPSKECTTCQSESTTSQDTSTTSFVDYQTPCSTCKQNQSESTTSQVYTSTTSFVDYQTPCSTCKRNQTEPKILQDNASTTKSADNQTPSKECTTCKRNHTESTASSDYNVSTSGSEKATVTPCATCKRNHTESTASSDYNVSTLGSEKATVTPCTTCRRNQTDTTKSSDFTSSLTEYGDSRQASATPCATCKSNPTSMTSESSTDVLKSITKSNIISDQAVQTSSSYYVDSAVPSNVAVENQPTRDKLVTNLDSPQINMDRNGNLIKDQGIKETGSPVEDKMADWFGGTNKAQQPDAFSRKLRDNAEDEYGTFNRDKRQPRERGAMENKLDRFGQGLAKVEKGMDDFDINNTRNRNGQRLMVDKTPDFATKDRYGLPLVEDGIDRFGQTPSNNRKDQFAEPASNRRRSTFDNALDIKPRFLSLSRLKTLPTMLVHSAEPFVPKRRRWTHLIRPTNSARLKSNTQRPSPTVTAGFKKIRYPSQNGQSLSVETTSSKKAFNAMVPSTDRHPSLKKTSASSKISSSDSLPSSVRVTQTSASLRTSQSLLKTPTSLSNLPSSAQTPTSSSVRIVRTTSPIVSPASKSAKSGAVRSVIVPRSMSSPSRQ